MRSALRRCGYALPAFLLLATAHAAAQTLGPVILQDPRLAIVAQKARQLLSAGFSAGAGIYSPVFIRDFNTFLPISCEVLPPQQIKSRLIGFLSLQAGDGGIPDAYNDTAAPDTLVAPAQASRTVESDQESSLVQAVSKYVACSHDTAFPSERVRGIAVLERLRRALEYVRRTKMDAQYGLVTGGTAIDWGDVQAEDVPGGTLDANSHLAISIYPNAMFVIAIDDFAAFLSASDPLRTDWLGLRQTIAGNTRRYLWDPQRQKFRPHLYLTSSPFPAQFDENTILFEGGTTVAIEAGLLSPEEIAEANAQMLAAQRASGAFGIAGSIAPPYPAGYFDHPILCEYCYQNGGLWQWFAGRMVRQLAVHGMLRQAYDELQPMLDQVIHDGDFFEWYTLDNKPSGAPNFRGGAGVLALAIEAVQQAAASDRSSSPIFENRIWSYRDLPPGFNWKAQNNSATGDVVYYGTAPAGVQAPLAPGETVYVGPDSNFYYFNHAPPIAPGDLVHRWTPLRVLPVSL